ncbi:MAG: hypothetical protein H0U18_03255 [Pyrinomonadaceae bacterium]|nr:hypothetical protein [Pyrinomonadaceae bacterium]
MKKRVRTKLVHEGKYVAEVDVELVRPCHQRMMPRAPSPAASAASASLMPSRW